MKSSSTLGSAGIKSKRRPLSAHVTQSMVRSKPPPTFDTSKTRRQLDVIERDLKLTTKAIQDRLGISKQGFVWKERWRFSGCNVLSMATFIKDKESGELTLYEDAVFYLPGLTSWGKVLLVTFKSWVQKLLSACENRNGTPALEGLDGVYMLLIAGNWTTVAWEKTRYFHCQLRCKICNTR